MIYLFDKDEKFITLIKRQELKEAIQEEYLNGIDRLDFDLLLKLKDKLKGAAYLAHKEKGKADEFYYYKINSLSNNSDSLHTTAIASQFDDLRAYGYLREFRRDNATAREAAEIVFGGSRWEVVQADDTPQRPFYIYDLSRLEALKKLIETYNVELEFRVIIDKNRIVRRIVKIHNRRGQKVNKRFFYGTNALEVVKEESRPDIVTAVIGRGKGEEKFDTSGEATGGFGRRINFKEIEWSKEKGDPLDKPLGQEYIELKEATQKYGYSDGTPRFKIVVHDQITTPEELIQACYNDLINLSRPLVQFKASILETGDVNIGDGVQIIRKDLDIYYTARVFKIKRDLLDASLTSVEFGDNIEYNQASKNKELVNQLQNLNNRVSEVAKSANLTFIDVLEEMRKGLENSYFNQDGYNYELKVGNPYKLPAGYYSFNAPIENNPTKVIYMGAGTMAIANKKDSTGKWQWQTFGTGDGILAEAIVGKLGEFATVNANQINVNNDFATTELGKKVVVQDELYNNVKITQAKGLQVLDNYNRERVQLGNWAANRYGLKVTDESGNKTVLDDNGILQTWQDGRCDNADNGHPLKIPIFIPKETARVYKAYLRLYIESFRAYSRALTTAESKYSTTKGGGFQSAFGTTDGGGGSYDTTHGMAQVNGGNVRRTVTDFQGKHIGFAEDYHVSSHEHNLRIDQHRHEVNVKISDHDHGFTIPAHDHEIVYGIYEESNYDSKMEIYINGRDRTSTLTGGGYFNSTQSELDITNYLNKGSWNIVEIKTRQRMRIDATVFIQALLNYGGY